MSLWAVPAAVGFALAGLVVVLVLVLGARLRVGGKTTERSRGNKTVEMTCTVCQRALVFSPAEMVLLSPPESALVVRSHPKVVGRRLAEFICPYCDAAHCFCVQGKAMDWLGANLYEPQTKGSLCGECKRPLRRPPWSPGAYAGRFSKIPELLPDFGLLCPYCGAVCCVACCTDATRGRTPDGSMLCPRCFRGPLETVFDF